MTYRAQVLDIVNFDKKFSKQLHTISLKSSTYFDSFMCIMHAYIHENAKVTSLCHMTRILHIK